jgi:hypothetical protein
LVLLGVAVALAVLVLGQGGATPAAAQPADPHYKCYDIPAGPAPGVDVELETQFGVEPAVTVGAPAKLCVPVTKNGEGSWAWPDLKCYTIEGKAGPFVRLQTQFGVEDDQVYHATLLCVPAAKTIVPATPEPTPPPPDWHWECFDINGHAPTPVPAVDLESDPAQGFPPELNVPVGQATKLCAPALKNGDGSLSWPHLECYTIDDPPPGPSVNLTTQFGVEPGVVVGRASLLCVPALKELLSVGGVAELPPVAGASAEEAGAPAEGSGWSAGGYAALAAGVAAAVLALGAGTLYARRRWLR